MPTFWKTGRQSLPLISLYLALRQLLVCGCRGPRESWRSRPRHSEHPWNPCRILFQNAARQSSHIHLSILRLEVSIATTFWLRRRTLLSSTVWPLSFQNNHEVVNVFRRSHGYLTGTFWWTRQTDTRIHRSSIYFLAVIRNRFVGFGGGRRHLSSIQRMVGNFGAAIAWSCENFDEDGKGG